MTSGTATQQARYRAARAAGATMHTACAESGLLLSLARLIEAGKPLPHEAKEPEMPRPKKAKPISGEVPKPDFELGVKIYREDIKPAKARQAEPGQEMSTAYKEIKKHAHLHPGAAKIVFQLDGMEESKRDDFLRTFSGLLKELRIFMPADLVDVAEGKGEANENVVPIGERAAPTLATIPPEGDTDLAGGDDDHAIAAE